MSPSREFVKLLRHFPVKKSSKHSKEDIGSIWDNLSHNPNVTLELVLERLDLPWDWSGLSSQLSWADVIANPNLPWDWGILMARKDVTSEIILKKFPNMKKRDMKGGKKWDYKYLSRESDIMDLIREDPRRGHWKVLSHNDHVTLKFVEHFIDKPWDWFVLSFHPCMSLEFVRAHPEKPWSWGSLSSNDSIPLQELIKDPKFVWDRVASRDRIDWDVIRKNPALPWHWGSL